MSYNITPQEEFAWNLYKELALHSQNNIIFSPLSIYVVLAMLQFGTRDNTDKELQNVLGMYNSVDQLQFHRALQNVVSKLKSTHSPILYIAEQIYAERSASIVKEFQSQLETHYSTSVNPVDFKESKSKICDEINNWVKDRTKSKITQLLSPELLDADTMLILVTAIYMNAEWSSKFSKKRNIPYLFHLTDGSKITVEMMEQTEKFKYCHFDRFGCSVLELPYAGAQISMFVILPDSEKNLDDLEKSLTAQNVFETITTLKDTIVCVKLLKFSLESSIPFKDPLAKLGLTELFSKEKANLTGISNDAPLFVSSIVHNAMINVHEEGTEAASSSAVIARKNRSIRGDVVDFIVDRPFIFLVRESVTQAVVFIGRLTNPQPFIDKSEL